MVIEYMLTLLISAMILAGAFSFGKGPVGMFQKNTPYLAWKVENHLETGDKKFRSEWKRPD